MVFVLPGPLSFPEYFAVRGAGFPLHQVNDESHSLLLAGDLVNRNSQMARNRDKSSRLTHTPSLFKHWPAAAVWERTSTRQRDPFSSPRGPGPLERPSAGPRHLVALTIKLLDDFRAGNAPIRAAALALSIDLASPPNSCLTGLPRCIFE